MLTKTQVKVILILLDNKGHAQWELADYLEMQDSNLSPLLKELAKKGIIYQGDARRSNNRQKKEGDYKEFPYYLANNLDGLKSMIREVAKSAKVFETGFILEIIRVSRYIKLMREIAGEELDECMDKEIRENYKPFTDRFFTEIIEPSLNGKTYLEARACMIEPNINRKIDLRKILREGDHVRRLSWRDQCFSIVVDFGLI